jgi:hypothetical protein
VAVLLASSSVALANLQFKPFRGSNGFTAVVVSGDFSATDEVAGLVTQMTAIGAHIVAFDSPGGQPYKAMELGRLIRRMGYDTFQPRALECASACALAFLGGNHRTAEPGSIGVHQSYFNGSEEIATKDAVPAIQQLTSDEMAYLKDMGVDAGLLQLALQYDSSDIRYLSGKEMASLNVTTEPATPPPSSSTASPPDVPLPSVERPQVDDPTSSGGDAVAYFFSTDRTEPTKTGSVDWTTEPHETIRGAVQLAGAVDLDLRFGRSPDGNMNSGGSFNIAFHIKYPFGARHIDQVTGIWMKASIDDTQHPIDISYVSRAGDDFAIVLRSEPERISSNMERLERFELLCVGFVYNDLKNASLCVEKGTPGRAIFHQALAAASPSKPSAAEGGPARTVEGDWDITIPLARSGRVRHPNGYAILVSQPNVSAFKMMKLKNGTTVYIEEASNYWYHVRAGLLTGYLHSSWVFVDQYDAGGFEQGLHIQIRSFDNRLAAEAFVRHSSIPVVAYLASNGWYAVALRDTFGKTQAKAVARHLKKTGDIPADSLLTYGNNYVRKACCG